MSARECEIPPYSPEDRIFPSESDKDLWNSVLIHLLAAYPERALPEHVRQAFVSVCEDSGESMLFKDFLRKVTIAWMWKRPPAPRGLSSLE